MTVPSWSTTDQWDTLMLGGQLIPGVARLDINMGSGLDVQKPTRGKNASIADDGTPPAELTITVTLADADEATRFSSAILLLRPTAKSASLDPLEIVHPLAQMWDISAVSIGSISSPSPTSGGSLVVTIRAVQWAPAPTPARKPAPTPKGAGAESGRSPAPEADVDALIAALAPANDAAP